jgi:hypothetical protein
MKVNALALALAAALVAPIAASAADNTPNAAALQRLSAPGTSIR